MKQKKIILGLVLLILIILTLTSCIQQKPVTIGFVASLTGSTSELGVNGRNGLMMAVEEINAGGGINGRLVEVVVKDDKNDPENGLAVDQALYEDGISFIIGHMTSSMAKTSLPFVNENKLLMISPTMSSYELANQDDHFITVVSSNDIEAAFIAGRILENGGKNVAVIYESKNRAYTETIKDFLASELSGNGGKVIYEEAFLSGANPAYLEISDRVLNAKPDSIVILASSFDSAMFCQQFYKSGNQEPIYLSLWAMNNDLILQGGDSVEDVYIPSLLDTESERPEYLAFKNVFLKKYSAEPTFAATYSYESAMILFDSLKKTNSYDPEIIKAAIIEKSVFEGLQDDINIDEWGDASRTLYLYRIKDGQFKKAE
ncbi:ABC transporter substrate-binding protein [Acetobacterium sp.]|uniref:ABC transporter substrate-binding protein n=1 Tax=Acetobacterium sp. TaxID=1872094 RepID=UPI003592FBF7